MTTQITTNDTPSIYHIIVCDGAFFRCLITITIYNNHLSIHIFEGSKSGIAMRQELVRTHHRTGISKGQRLKC